jgi:spoIIIJ-associated protein
LIGKEGKTLNALQTLIRQSIKNNTGLLIKLNLDVSNYKLKKLKNIERLVRGIAEDVEASQISVSLDPMNSYERRLVHTLIDEYPNLITESTGEGKERHVTIKYKEN